MLTGERGNEGIRLQTPLSEVNLNVEYAFCQTALSECIDPPMKGDRERWGFANAPDRKSTRLNSSHL